jgi:subtilisin family serine protease
VLLSRTVLALGSLLALLAAPAPAGAASLIQARPGKAGALRAAGAVRLVPALRIWGVPTRSLVRLDRARAIELAEPDRRLYRDASFASPLDEPLASTEWWRSVIGADAVPAPGPGKPITLVDSGVDISHPEFASRPDTTMLNDQELVLDEDDHGTEVASVIGAPVNGVGIAGVYPQAVLRSWDASPLGFITTASAVRGIVAAANRGPGVINMSFGGESPDPLIGNAVLYAVRHGSVVVASSGNDGLAGNPLSYPASYPHVLTIGATEESGIVSSFSSESVDVDLVAPGRRITVAEPLSYDPSGYVQVSGTSFSAPMVAAAAAWVWTMRPQLDNTQVFDVMRMSAHDLQPTGYDQASGFGLLDIPKALEYPAPAKDPLEPNDDIAQVKPKGIFATGETPLTTASRASGAIRARVDRHEDPRDVYRAYVGAAASLTARTSGGQVELRIFRSGAGSVDSASAAAARTSPGALTYRNPLRRGVYVYVEVRPTRGVPRASYSLRVSRGARR